MDNDISILDELRSANITGLKTSPCKSIIYEGFLLGRAEGCTVFGGFLSSV